MTRRYVTPDPYAHIRAAFREVALGLMEWQEPAETTERRNTVFIVAVVTVETDGESELLGTYWKTDEGIVLYTHGPDATVCSAPRDCVRVVRLRVPVSDAL